MEEISTKCPAGHKHFRTERKLTKQSAVYHPQLAASLAGHIAAALGQRSKEEDDRAELRLEKIVNNDAFFRPEWKVGSEWRWQRPAHINIFEGRFVAGLLRALTIEGGVWRFSALLDSRSQRSSCERTLIGAQPASCPS